MPPTPTKDTKEFELIREAVYDRCGEERKNQPLIKGAGTFEKLEVTKSSEDKKRFRSENKVVRVDYCLRIPNSGSEEPTPFEGTPTFFIKKYRNDQLTDSTGNFPLAIRSAREAEVLRFLRWDINLSEELRELNQIYNEPVFVDTLRGPLIPRLYAYDPKSYTFVLEYVGGLDIGHQYMALDDNEKRVLSRIYRAQRAGEVCSIEKVLGAKDDQLPSNAEGTLQGFKNRGLISLEEAVDPRQSKIATTKVCDQRFSIDQDPDNPHRYRIEETESFKKDRLEKVRQGLETILAFHFIARKYEDSLMRKVHSIPRPNASLTVVQIKSKLNALLDFEKSYCPQHQRLFDEERFNQKVAPIGAGLNNYLVNPLGGLPGIIDTTKQFGSVILADGHPMNAMVRQHVDNKLTGSPGEVVLIDFFSITYGYWLTDVIDWLDFFVLFCDLSREEEMKLINLAYERTKAQKMDLVKNLESKKFVDTIYPLFGIMRSIKPAGALSAIVCNNNSKDNPYRLPTHEQLECLNRRKEYLKRLRYYLEQLPPERKMLKELLETLEDFVPEIKTEK